MHGIGHLPEQRQQRDNIPKNVFNNGESRRTSMSCIDGRLRTQFYVNVGESNGHELVSSFTNDNAFSTWK